MKRAYTSITTGGIGLDVATEHVERPAVATPVPCLDHAGRRRLAKADGVAPRLAREGRRMSSGDRLSVVLIGEDEEAEAQEPGVVVDTEHNVAGNKGDCCGTKGVEAGSTPDH
ncbi:hypothetical protein BHE74_00014686 [Ensete ventricosum]|uniref:Uncharacterized protein n=1 Tax=Ensete ventricosum TaxID=4639 RepID=A0A427AWH0_ENSVE|nr:hypothetical protein B296_00020672 [Ensete ventricosum]RWV95553.1 hypothetical protein GW17_00041817 [Ensete ventricosum]RWW77174.1 hypothetical protein BHE74_00014686 [Ensete ventricosum]RZR91617.1 hypothetical protein BHM03_00019786 [Ensete ventricosum]